MLPDRAEISKGIFVIGDIKVKTLFNLLCYILINISFYRSRICEKL